MTTVQLCVNILETMMKKLLKAPIGVQLSALFLVFVLVLFVLTVPWQIVVFVFGILATAVSIVRVAAWLVDNS